MKRIRIKMKIIANNKAKRKARRSLADGLDHA